MSFTTLLSLIACTILIFRHSLNADDLSSAAPDHEDGKTILEQLYLNGLMQNESLSRTITIAANDCLRSSVAIISQQESPTSNSGGAVMLTIQSNGQAGTIDFREGCSGFVAAIPFKEDAEYSQHVPIRTCILSELQLSHFFSNSPPRQEPLNFYGLVESNLYLIVQIKNVGPRPVQGLLRFYYFDNPVAVSIDLNSDMREFYTYVVPLGMSAADDFIYPHEVKKYLDGFIWEELSTGMTREEAEECIGQWYANVEGAEREDATTTATDDESQTD